MTEIQEPIPEEPNYEANQPTTRQWVIIAAIGLFALCSIIVFLAGGYFTATSFLEDRNIHATETAAAATAVVVAREQAIQSAADWPLVLLEPFNNNDNEWVEGDVNDEYADITVTINDVYTWETKAKQGFVWWVWPTSDSTSDFYLAVDVQNQSDNRDAPYGLLFRYSDETEAYNYLEIHDTQYLSVWNYDLGEWTELIPSTLSTAIRPGENNHLEVIAQRDYFYFLINGEIVGETTISNPSEGYAGVAIGLSYKGEESTIVFDNFELRAP